MVNFPYIEARQHSGHRVKILLKVQLLLFSLVVCIGSSKPEAHYRRQASNIFASDIPGGGYFVKSTKSTKTVYGKGKGKGNAVYEKRHDDMRMHLKLTKLSKESKDSKDIKDAKKSKKWQPLIKPWESHVPSLLPSSQPSSPPSFVVRATPSPTFTPTTASPTNAPVESLIQQAVQSPTVRPVQASTESITREIQLSDFEICYFIDTEPEEEDIRGVIEFTASYLRDFFTDLVLPLSNLITNGAPEDEFESGEPFCINYQTKAIFFIDSGPFPDEAALERVLSLGLTGGYFSTLIRVLYGNIFRLSSSITMSDHLNPQSASENTKSTDDQSTGTGTIFGIMGGVLFAAGAIIIVVRKRRSGQDFQQGKRTVAEMSVDGDTHADTFYTMSVSDNMTAPRIRGHSEQATHTKSKSIQYHTGNDVHGIDFQCSELQSHFSANSGDDPLNDIDLDDMDELGVRNYYNKGLRQSSSFIAEDDVHTESELSMYLNEGGEPTFQTTSKSLSDREIISDEGIEPQFHSKSRTEPRKQEAPSHQSWPSLQERMESLRSMASGNQTWSSRKTDPEQQQSSWPSLQSRLDAFASFAVGKKFSHPETEERGNNEHENRPLPWSLQPPTNEKGVPDEIVKEITVHSHDSWVNRGSTDPINKNQTLYHQSDKQGSTDAETDRSEEDGSQPKNLVGATRIPQEQEQRWPSIKERMAKFKSTQAPAATSSISLDQKQDKSEDSEDEDVPMRVIDLINKFN